MRFSDQCGFYELNSFPGCNQICVSWQRLVNIINTETENQIEMWARELC